MQVITHLWDTLINDEVVFQNRDKNMNYKKTLEDILTNLNKSTGIEASSIVSKERGFLLCHVGKQINDVQTFAATSAVMVSVADAITLQVQNLPTKKAIIETGNGSEIIAMPSGNKTILVGLNNRHSNSPTTIRKMNETCKIISEILV
jgi:predicted regulator of Ras-like GTPase activity (Roadblock/LC7/MglB family)